MCTPPDNPEGAVVWLPSYHFHLNMATSGARARATTGTPTTAASSASSRWGGRLTFVANYQAVLGDEFHPFDPNQGNYTIDRARACG
jgi:hypothetical protein